MAASASVESPAPSEAGCLAPSTNARRNSRAPAAIAQLLQIGLGQVHPGAVERHQHPGLIDTQTGSQVGYRAAVLRRRSTQVSEQGVERLHVGVRQPVGGSAGRQQILEVGVGHRPDLCVHEPPERR